MPSYPSDWQQWADGVLAGVGAPADPVNLSTLWDWSHSESGSAVMRWNNPLNTTQPAAGAVSQNSVGVKSYPDIPTGVNATVQTLLNGRYGTIVSNLKGDVPQSSWGNACGELGTWGTGCGWLGSQAAVNPGVTSPSGGGTAAGGAGAQTLASTSQVPAWAQALGISGMGDLALRGVLFLVGLILVVAGIITLFHAGAQVRYAASRAAIGAVLA